MELYRAGWDCAALRSFTEDLLRALLMELHPSGVLNGIDFALPFARVPIVAALNEKACSSLPEGVSEADRSALEDLCRAHGLPVTQGPADGAPASLGRLVDRLVGLLVEPHCVQPTFLEDHPTVMSPLAKAHGSKGPLVADRFELFIGGLEYVNAYSELNDPEEQLRRLEHQVAEGDPEVCSHHSLDPIGSSFVCLFDCSSLAGSPRGGPWLCGGTVVWAAALRRMGHGCGSPGDAAHGHGGH